MIDRKDADMQGPIASFPADSLAMLLRDRTHRLHVAAEKSGIVRDLLRGQADRQGYALYLRNLLPVYAAMEHGLEQRRERGEFAVFARPALYRTARMEADLTALAGFSSWRDWPLLAEGEAYAKAVTRATDGDGFGLIGHAYVRYMGDLSGGQFLKAHLARTLGLGPDMLGLYDFTGLTDRSADPEAMKSEVRAALDTLGAVPGRGETVVTEAVLAFESTIAVSEAVKQHVAKA